MPLNGPPLGVETIAVIRQWIAAGAILLAADALTGHTGAARLFTEVRLLDVEPERRRRVD